MTEQIPDALPEGFGENVEVNKGSPHPNKECKHRHILEEWHDLERDFVSEDNAGLVPLGPKDIAVMCAGLSTLVCDVRNGMITFGHFGDSRDKKVENDLKKQCRETLKKLLPLADPRHLPGSEYADEGGSDE